MWFFSFDAATFTPNLSPWEREQLRSFMRGWSRRPRKRSLSSIRSTLRTQTFHAGLEDTLRVSAKTGQGLDLGEGRSVTGSINIALNEVVLDTMLGEH